MPVPARIGGRAEGLNALLKTCGWEAVSNDEHWQLVTISAGLTAKNGPRECNPVIAITDRLTGCLWKGLVADLRQVVVRQRHRGGSG
ncbi:hypothetical protein [Enterobacter kobei]|nr:Uncharacterised protein [Enterobacter kobei]